MRPLCTKGKIKKKIKRKESNGIKSQIQQIQSHSDLLREELGENGYKLQYSKLRGRYLHVIKPTGLWIIGERALS